MLIPEYAHSTYKLELFVVGLDQVAQARQLYVLKFSQYKAHQLSKIDSVQCYHLFAE